MVTVKIYYHPGVLSLDNAVNIHNITVAGGGEKRERNGRRTGTERERELR